MISGKRSGWAGPGSRSSPRGRHGPTDPDPGDRPGQVPVQLRLVEVEDIGGGFPVQFNDIAADFVVQPQPVGAAGAGPGGQQVKAAGGDAGTVTSSQRPVRSASTMSALPATSSGSTASNGDRWWRRRRSSSRRGCPREATQDLGLREPPDHHHRGQPDPVSQLVVGTVAMPAAPGHLSAPRPGTGPRTPIGSRHPPGGCRRPADSTSTATWAASCPAAGTGDSAGSRDSTSTSTELGAWGRLPEFDRRPGVPERHDLRCPVPRTDRCPPPRSSTAATHPPKPVPFTVRSKTGQVLPPTEGRLGWGEPVDRSAALE